MKKILQLLTLATLLATSLSAAPIHDAAEIGDLAEIERLIAEDPTCVNAQDVICWTPLHIAARYGNMEIAELLIKHDADVNSKNIEGATPLRLAASFGHTTIAQLLIACGANIHATRWTPLHWAENHDHIEIVRLRLKTLSRLNEILWNAVCKGDLKSAKWALFQGASPRAIALESMFPITDNTPEDVINYLRALTERQDTLMHVAVKNKNAEMVKLLLAFGGKTNIRNKEGKTALDLVFEYEAFLTILPLILEATVAEPDSEYGQAFIRQLHDLAEAEPKAPQFRPVYSQRKDLEEFANSLRGKQA